MNRLHFPGLIRNGFFLLLFAVVILAGWSLNLSLQNYIPRVYPAGAKLEEVPRGIRISEKMAEYLIGSVNSAMAGDTDIEHLTRDHLGRKFAENMFTSSINALAYHLDSDEEFSSLESGEPLPDEFPLPAIRMEVGELAAPELVESAKNSRIVFYCTHSMETYIPDSGQARMNGKRGLVNNVAEYMAELINKKGVAAQHINTIHDWPEYNESYTKSRNTVKQVLDSEDAPVLALFDVHRDSIPGSTHGDTITVEGRKSAVILIVVGTDERKEHPYWKKNLAFAQEIYQQGQLMYPGLIKGVRTKAGTYNQEYHDHALLLEMGSDYNRLEEAQYAGTLFTEVLLKVLEKEVE